MKKPLGLLIALVVALLLLTIILPGEPLLAQDRQDPPKLGNDFDLYAGDYYLPGEGEVESPLPDTQYVPGPLDFTLLTFMSLRDDNWEIYTSNFGGGDLERLTNNNVSDASPRLNRGTSALAFSSNRDGNYEIYAMDRDGKNVRRLTYANGTDDNPAWSYDGQKIVFESERDGNKEIYIMNADGSDQTRLTNHSAYDGQPNMSPDGAYIIFTTRRKGDDIWIMNADGSNAHKLTGMRYIQNAVYSPDGSKIAFDGDNNGDGWQEIWVMDANGSNKRRVYTAPALVDPYVRGWSPEGSNITFTWTKWVYYQGAWYWTTARPSIADYQTGAVGAFNASFDVEWFPDWQFDDITPPSSAVLPLPAYMNESAAIWWNIWENSTHGYNFIDIQYRLGKDGPWQYWLMHAVGAKFFTKRPGETVYFRSQATDGSGNVEEWPTDPDGDAHTTYYNWKISGRTTDNRLMPYSGIMIEAPQQAFESSPSDDNGDYFAYFADDDPVHPITYGRDGSLPIPSTDFSSDADTLQDVIVPPDDNIIIGANFEFSDFANQYWQTGGSLPPILTTDQRHSGVQGVQFGPLPLMELGTVAHFAADMDLTTSRPVRQDATGRLHAIWSEDEINKTKRYYYASGDQNGKWSAPLALTPASKIDNLLWEVTTDGHVQVVWEESGSTYDVVYQTWMNDDGWHETQVIHDSGRAALFELQFDSQGRGHIIWQGNQNGKSGILYNQIDPTGVWSDPESLDHVGGPIDSLAIDQQDNLHLLWTVNRVLFYSQRLPNNSWSEFERISSIGHFTRFKTLTIDDNDGVHVVWEGQRSFRLYHAKRLPGGGWPAPTALFYYSATNSSFTFQAIPGPEGDLVIIAGPGEENDRYDTCTQLSFAHIDESGALTHIQDLNPGNHCFTYFWTQRQDQQVIVQVHRLINEDHQYCQMVMNARKPGDISQCVTMPAEGAGPETPFSLVAADGSSHVFWQKSMPNGQTGFLHTRSLANTAAGDSLLQYAVAIPPEMTNPTLSFAYQQATNGTASTRSLNLSIDDGLTTTLLFTGTTTGGWTYQYADLTPWTGQEVTATFLLQQEIGAPFAWAYLDEAFLGSAYPDAWATIDGPYHNRPGDNIELIFYYGNFSSAGTGGIVLTATLPVELTSVVTSPAPISHSGQRWVWRLDSIGVGDSPALVTVSALISPTESSGLFLPVFVELSCDEPDSNLLNNGDQFLIDISLKSYLPLVGK